MATTAVKIVGGPSKWDLIIMGLAEQQPVTFKLETGEDVQVKVRACSNEENWDTLTPEDEEIGRVGGWLIEGERLHTETDTDTGPDMEYIVYASYDTHDRRGLYRVVENDNAGEGPYHEKLRFEWGDRVWGNSSWWSI